MTQPSLGPSHLISHPLGRVQHMDSEVLFSVSSQRPNLKDSRLHKNIRGSREVLTPLGRDVGTDSVVSAVGVNNLGPSQALGREVGP